MAMDGQGIGQGGAGRGRIRAFRLEDAAARADAQVAAFDAVAGAAFATRALRAERRCKGGAGYDLLRHIGLVRRLKRPSPSLRRGA
jgi:hypothetical protein